MNILSIRDIESYVESHIGAFHDSRLKGLEIKDLKVILKKKNPYLFRVKNLDNAGEVVRGIFDAYISSSEEAKFGDWLEGLAIYINSKVYGGIKSAAIGVDLEFDKGGTRYLVAIKSGPNWGNSDQIRKMIDNFAAAKRTLKTSNSKLRVEAVNGCCYGRSKEELKKGDYYKYCGQRFWEFISGDNMLYLTLIAPLGKKAKERNEEYTKLHAAKLNLLTKQFINEFCLGDGSINWEKILRLNSSVNGD